MVYVGKETRREGLCFGENPAIMQIVKAVSMKQIYVRQTFLIDSCYKIEGKR